jgi:predicted signal transduction protein with EAL and GGDEF domain
MILDSKLLGIINDSKLSGTEEDVELCCTNIIEQNDESIDDLFDWMLL